MSYQADFNGWDELTLADLLGAYRKAKADVFYENTFPTAIKFARNNRGQTTDYAATNEDAT